MQVLAASKAPALAAALESAHLLRPAVGADMVDDNQQHMLLYCRVPQVVGMHLKQHAVHLRGSRAHSQRTRSTARS